VCFQFKRDSALAIDAIQGKKLVICCDGRNGIASQELGLSDENIYHSTGSYGALAIIDRPGQTLIPQPEQRIHNIGFDLSAYVPSAYEEDGKSKFTLKIFGNTRSRLLAIAVRKSDSKVVRALKTVLDKSVSDRLLIHLR